MPRLVFICGGNGSQILYPWGGHVDVTVISPTADSGGSSGVLTREYDILPPGDMRRALVVGIPSNRRRPIERLFESRHLNGRLKDHAVGNIIFLDSFLRIPDPNRALDELGRIFGTHQNWRVRPATLRPIALHATLSDGGSTENEGELDTRKHNASVTDAWIEPASVPANPEAVHAIRNAHLIVIGPTDHMTSLMPILLVREIALALRKTSAKLVYVANLMTKRNETYEYSLKDYVDDIERYADITFNDIIVNSGKVPTELAEQYRRGGQRQVLHDGHVSLPGNPRIWSDDLLFHYSDNEERRFVRHDPYRTSQLIVQIFPTLKHFAYGRELD